MKLVSRFILLSSLLFILLSCNRDLGGRYHIDWGSWGDEIVYNDTDIDLIVELRENKRIDNRDTTQIYTMILKPSQCDTLAISNFSKYPCIEDSDEIWIFSGEEQLARFIKGENDFFNNYEYEEREYHFVIEGNEMVEDRPWPTYRYHITDETIQDSNEF